jgi:hypothetical protein
MARFQELARIMGELPEVAEGEHQETIDRSVRGKGISRPRPPTGANRGGAELD